MTEEKKKKEARPYFIKRRPQKAAGESSPKQTAELKKTAEPSARTEGKKAAFPKRPIKKQAKNQESVRVSPQRSEKKTAPISQIKPKRSAPAKRGDAKKLRVFFLGGLQEIGKNMCVLEYGDDLLIIDSGIAFPDEEMPGVDLVIPDITYIEQNSHKVKGILLTHGHEDHIGGVPYLLKTVNAPVYGTALTLGILKNKLNEFRLPKKPDLRTVESGSILELGVFTAEFIHVNHSIPGASALSITTPHGVVFHTGDFKLDVSPIDGHMMDIGRIAAIGDRGVLLMLGESTNAEREGYTPSERRVGGSLEQLFTKYPDRRLLIATFSSNVHRVQQIIDTSVRHNRRVVVFGRSMTAVVKAAVELGYIKAPEGTIIEPQEMKRFREEELTLLTTGSQGEPMSALYRMAFSEHDRVKLTSRDVVVLSSSAIPGNEKLIGKIVNALVKNGIRVENDSSIEGIHVSGHACSEELKLMLALLRPQYFMPIHGEPRHLFAHKEIAEFMGIEPKNIFLGENGFVLELDRRSAKWGNPVPAGRVLVDGSGVGDVGSAVLRDRLLLSEDGIIAVVATVAPRDGLIFAGPEIITRGFVYVKEAEKLMHDIKALAERTLTEDLDRGIGDFGSLKNNLKDELSRFLFQKTKRRPMVLPILLSV